jgi:hypothetical protein
MRNPPSRVPGDVLAAVLLVLSAVFAWRTAPLAANVDDHVRLYFGGYVGLKQLAGGPQAAALRTELQRSTLGFRDEYLASRFVTASTPYSPLTLAAVAVAETLRPLLPPTRVLPWVLGEQAVLWALILGLALRARALLPACPLPWFLALGLTLAWIHGHTSPFYPVPRAFACLLTGLALALAATGASFRWAAACALLAAASHPYNQAVNLAVALPAAAVLAGTPAAPALTRQTGLRLGAVAVAALGASLLMLYVANPRGDFGVGGILGERLVFDPAGSWRMSRTPLQRLIVAVALPLGALVLRYCGWRRATVLGAYCAATLVAAATLQPAGHYPTEYLSRVGGAWVAVLFGLCLRGDLLPDLSALVPARGAAVVVCTALVTLPAAFPELTGVPNVVHRPLRGWPGGIRLSPVEEECIRLLRQFASWPPVRRPRQGTGGSATTR